MGILGFHATPMKMDEKGDETRNEREMRKEIRTATHGAQHEDGRARGTDSGSCGKK